ncbi:beta barrel domain-containing protein [Pasteurella multocida]|uniref:beta barrel domain-containing protein n=2 Tax=Pasteurella multocida TaxID=747 RepID=UPI00099B1EE9|nr:hypothetical protein [Pasteurella multocida]ARA70980.1 hypothetical protein BTV67_10645 [Pasteurella multocida subsp. multocida]ARA88449.1 hypothetical protein BTV66_01940 [Pasteurella multocida subsp. septica]MCL7779004.1 hypothetical protein [Pasteurella multocida]OPC88778.1 hypothetical protein BTV51_05550 [Pasteurella multocida subsp. septica]OPC96013.1 hypothetical protein BTV53_06195 [Pasteurella multocida subsp. septica]
MNKDWLKNLKVGDTVYFVETGGRSTFERETEVLKIGRKYLTIKVLSQDRKINLSDGYEESKYGAFRSRIYRDKKDYLHELKLIELRFAVKKKIASSYFKLTSEDAEAINNLLDKYTE